MDCYVFADESGTDSQAKCYAIGAVTVPADVIDSFNATFDRLKQRHGVLDEVKWKRIGKGHGAMNFALDWLNLLLRSHSVTFDVIVVNKELYRNWHDVANRERAFYQTYTQLLRHIARQTEYNYQVYIDDRSDSYAKQHEVVGIITNHMLTALAASAHLTVVTKADSKLMPGIQIADMLTGAINTGHQLFLNPTLKIHTGKRLLLARMAQMLGWDALCYDTWPDPKFNIWHFPLEYRAKPATRHVRFADTIPYIKPEDLLSAE